MSQETNDSAAPQDGQQLISVSAGSDGTVWGISPAGALLVANFTNDATTGERQVTWQTIGSEVGWKQVAVGPSPGVEYDLWCLDKGGNVYVVTVVEGVSGKREIGNMTLAFLSVGADGTLWGLDANGKAFLYDATKNTWTAQTQPHPFTRLSVADATHVVALDSDGSAYALGQSGWQSIVSGLLDISASKDAYLVAIGNKGNLMIQVDVDWFDAGGEGMKTISAGRLSNIVALDGKGNFIDLTQGRTLTVGTGRKQSERFDTEDPFNETKSTHLWLVNRGAMLAGGEFGDKFRQLFQPNPAQTQPGGTVFHQAVCQGVYDADFVDFFNGPATVFNQPTYEAHFYDPDTQLNWRGHATPTALTRGRELFNSALAAYRAGRLDRAGYALGLSLHYLTDMGQPMHATNFTNVTIPLLWHGGFETIVLNIQNECPIPTTQTPDDTSQRPFHRPDDYFINLATKSKQLYQQRYKYGIGGIFSCDLGGLGHRPMGEQVAGVRTLLQPMLTNTIQTVAHYVTEWMKRAEDRVPLSHPPICAGHQGHDWASVLWSVDRVGQLQYSYAALNMDPVGFPLLRSPLWFTGTPSGSLPNAPTQLAACMSVEEYDGRELVFAIAQDGLYYISQVPPSGPDNGIANGWGPWTKLDNAPALKVICACPYTYNHDQKVTTGVSVWGVGEDGQLRFAYQRSKTDGVRFDPFKDDQIVWTDWQVVDSAPKNMTCITATGLGDRTGYIFGLADGVLYGSSQLDPRNGVGWTSWAKYEIPGTPKLRLICVCQAKEPRYPDYRMQLWGVDDQGILRSTTFASTTGQWSPWSGEWNANAPRNAVALTATTEKPDSPSLQLWAFAAGKLYAIYEKYDATTKQRSWADWSAVPTYDVPISTKISLPIGPLKLTIVGHDLPFLSMLITEDPDNPTQDPTSAIHNIRMAITDNPGPEDWMPGKLNLLTGALSDVTDHTGNFTTTYQGQFADNTHGSGTLSGKERQEQWTAAGTVTPRGAQPSIDSVFPADQVAAGFGQLLLIRGTDLPNTVMVSQDGKERLPQWTTYAKPEAALVRLPMDLHPGPATVRLINADSTVSTPEFPITISATPGAPLITAVTAYPRLSPVTKVAPGQKIAITAEGMDTSGAVIEWTHANLPVLGSAPEFTTDGVGGNFCVVTTVPNVTPNDTWTLSLRLSINGGIGGSAISSAFTMTLQT